MMTDKYRPFATQIARYKIARLSALASLFGLFAFNSSNAAELPVIEPIVVAAVSTSAAQVKPKESHIWMTIGERRFAVTLIDNAASRAFAAQLPLVLDMGELNGNEKKVTLPKPLPTNASQPGTIRNGDLMLWGASTLVVFYLTFESSYSYTRLGRVDDANGLAEALGRGGVRVTFSRR